MRYHLGWFGVLSLAVFWSSVLGGTAVAQAPAQDQCVACHLDWEDPVVEMYRRDVHAAHGIPCADCHGGDPTLEDMDEAMSPARGFIEDLQGARITQMCLQCHARVERLQAYGSTLNPEYVRPFPESVHGDADVATCITCHGVHDIRPHTDPASPVHRSRAIELCGRCHSDPNYMRAFNPALPTDQVEKYWTSRHGQRLRAGDTRVAVCWDCHDHHAIFPARDPRSTVHPIRVPFTCARCHSNPILMREYRLPANQFDLYAVSAHGKALLEKHDTGAPACNDCHGNHGALPPGVLSISHVCGTCHSINAEYFARSPHAEPFRAQNLPQCEVCHGNHDVRPVTDEMLHPGAPSICEKCHRQDDAGMHVAQQMYTTLTELRTQMERARQMLTVAEQKGLEVSDALMQLKDVRSALIRARTVTHQLNLDALKDVVQPALQQARSLVRTGEQALAEYRFRRMGLAVATLLTTLLVILLYIKLRQMEATSRGPRM